MLSREARCRAGQTDRNTHREKENIGEADVKERNGGSYKTTKIEKQRWRMGRPMKEKRDTEVGGSKNRNCI